MDDKHIRAMLSPLLMAETFGKGKYAWKRAPHLCVLDYEFRNLLNSDTDCLVVRAPARHGKSSYLAEWAPAWYLLNNPYKSVMLFSYAAKLASEKCIRARDIVHELSPLFGLKGVDRKFSAKDNWKIAETGGGMRSAGVGGTATGFGANCLDGCTLIGTEWGNIRADVLAFMKVQPRVWAYDESRGMAVLRRVVAVRVAKGQANYLIRTRGGAEVRVTGDHRIFTTDGGYETAKTLLRRYEANEDLPVLRLQGEQEGKALCRLRQGAEKNRRRGLLQTLRDRVRKESLRYSKGGEARARKLLLRGAVQGRRERHEEIHEGVQSLRKGGWPQQAVLQRRMQVGEAGGTESRKEVHELRGMRGADGKAFESNPVLQHRLQEQGTFKTDDGQSEFAPHARGVTDKDSQGRSEVHHGEGQESVCLLRECGRVADAPYRRGPGKQQAGESCDALRGLPHKPPQVGEDEIVLVRKVRGGSEFVYDFQVEGDSNFFASGILVHNCLLIDDYIKGVEEALNPRHLDKLWDWFQGTISTRLEVGGKMVVLSTQWSSRDIIGRLSENRDSLGLKIRFVTLQALREMDVPDPLGRKEGEPLWPEMFSKEDYENKRRTMGEFWFSAQYQGRPRSRTGGMIKIANRHLIDRKSVPLIEKYVRFWDRAATADGGCYSTGVLIGKAGNAYFIIDVIRKRMSADQIQALIKATAHADHAEYGTKVKTCFEREPGSSGKQVAEFTLRELAGFRASAVSPTGDKEFRAEALATAFASDLVFVVNAAWTAEFIDELTSFPGSKYKDQADAASGAFLELSVPSTKSKEAVVADGPSDNPFPIYGSKKPCLGCQTRHGDNWKKVRPAFNSDGFCCKCCKEAHEKEKAGDYKWNEKHTPGCNGQTTDWFNTREGKD